MAVRAGDEILGSIWAAVREPLSDERSQAFCDAAKLVALHMLRIRAGADVERRLRADLVSTALEGGAGARNALDRLGLADQHLVVLAVSMRLPHLGHPTRLIRRTVPLLHERSRHGRTRHSRGRGRARH